MTAFLMIFRRFPKILQNCSEGQTNVPEHFPKISENSRRCPKIAEDFRGRPEDVSMIHQRIPVQFKRQTWYHRNRWYLHMWRYIFTCEDIVSFLSICYHSLYHWLLYNKIGSTPWRHYDIMLPSYRISIDKCFSCLILNQTFSKSFSVAISPALSCSSGASNAGFERTWNFSRS